MPRWPLFIVACLPVMWLLPPRGSAHCQQFPKSTCEQHTDFVPGHNLLGEGIDITTLERKGAHLVDTSRWLDPNDTCVLCRNPLMDDQLQRLPLAGVDWGVHPLCDRQVSSSIEHFDGDVANVLAEEVKNNWKVELDFPEEFESVAIGQVVLVGSRSEMVSYAHEKTQEDRYSFVRHEISCELYWLRLHPSPTLLSPHFAHDAQNLPSEYDPEEYHDFIDTYGTHYVSQAQLGGRVRSLVPVRTCAATLAGIRVSDIKNCLSLITSLGWVSLLLSRRCRELLSNQAGAVFWEADDQRHIEGVGGSSQEKLLFPGFGKARLFSEWRKNITMNPGVVSHSLLPIHTLLERGDPRREMLKRSVSDYITQRALWWNCINYCPDGSYANLRKYCKCLCYPDAFTDSACCPRERGLAHLQVHIRKASGLQGDPFPFSASDAFVKVFFQGRGKRTRFITDNNNPNWSETLDFGPVKLTGLNYIEVQVWDKDVWEDDHLATCYKSLVAGGTSWVKCHAAHGHVDYYYVLTCMANLGGPTCRDYVPQRQYWVSK
ncbi:perforin-1-like isoform X1 [Sphaerodactylus townsendi]|uniref:Uncharacterized protein n=1 Tax=Sphaerodactylus townsendi TaxID=933632 RepID=A0ACB8EW15_9SAUR|nr:perforin-1-like isoform X1 [Sphaerodactylus townsendi]